MTQNTYRQIYQWGDKREVSLDEPTLEFLENYFRTDRQQQRAIAQAIRNDVPVQIQPGRMETRHLDFFREILRPENVLTDDFSRAGHALGKYYGDLLQLRFGQVPFPPDAVLQPDSHDQVQRILDYCNQHGIPVVPFGGGSSVTRALEAHRGGVSIDLKARMNGVLELNEQDFTIRVQAGILGPQLERYLNERGLTCGHFPQSFEFSTVGGWIAACGAGQGSTGYGRARDLMVALKVATPIGSYQSKDHPASAQAWDLNQLFAGSEGVLGVITEVTWKVFKHRPQEQLRAAFIFRDFESSVSAMREVMQQGCGKPHLFRISDGPETQFGFKHKGFDGTWKDRLLKVLGYLPPDRTTMMITVEGDRTYNRVVARNVRQITRRHGAIAAGTSPVEKWLKQRFESSYLRDAFMDAGYMIDTMETAVTWQRLMPVWQAIYRYMQQFDNRYYGMSHISHVYENGCNLYVIFMSPMMNGDAESTMQEFHKFQQGMIRTFVENGGSISHHHGVGRMGSSFMDTQFDSTGRKMLSGIKHLLDPNNIMNPGDILGLPDNEQR